MGSPPKFDYSRNYTIFEQGSGVKDCVKSLILEGYGLPQAEGGPKGELWNFFDRPQPCIYCCDKIWTWQVSFLKKLSNQNLCNCVNNQIFEDYPRQGRRMEKGWELFLTLPILWPNLNLSSVLWKKLTRVTGQRLCNCGNGLILEGYPQTEGEWREGCGVFVIDLNSIYVWSNLNWTRMLIDE